MNFVRLRWHHRLSRIQVAVAACLLVAGLLTVYSASPSDFRRQVLSVGLGLAVYGTAAALDYRRLARAALGLYVLCVLLLLAVHLVGHSALGARRWLSVGGFPLEPSELAKILMVVVLARYLGSRSGRIGWRQVLVACVLGAPPLLLIISQPDLGTAIVVGAVLAGMLFLAGAPRLQLAGMVVVVAAAVPIAPRLLHGYQRQRLEIFLDPGRDPLGAGYNLLQARIAVGSGGLFGQGYLHGAQGSLGFVPERATDFIFAMFAEQFGFIGSLVLLGLFALLLLSMVRSAALARDPFGRLLIGGMAVMIFIQVLENTGMNIGLTPIAGIPLPFISYGGSAMVTDLAALGLVQSVMLRRRLVVHSSPRPLEPYLLNDSGTVRLPMSGPMLEPVPESA